MKICYCFLLINPGHMNYMNYNSYMSQFQPVMLWHPAVSQSWLCSSAEFSGATIVAVVTELATVSDVGVSMAVHHLKLSLVLTGSDWVSPVSEGNTSQHSS